ncbi:beta-galactosidase [Actinoallomurus acanthiterrae]
MLPGILRLLARSRAAMAAILTLTLLGAGAGTVSVANAAPFSAAAPASAAGTAHSVTYDGYSFKIDGKRTYLWSAEFHYFRLPNQDLWRDVFQKVKAAGFNAVSLYFDWGYHSPAPGVYDFTGVRDVDKLLDIADQVGLYVIARPGPYINAEVDGGGFPGWLSTKAGNTRSDNADYLKYSDEWQSKIDAILARHQLTTGTGPVIEYQVENEYYNGSGAGRAYMKHLENQATADGIKVPLVGNNNGTFNAGTAALDVDGMDSYPQGFNCSNPSRWNGVPDISGGKAGGKPLETAEFQGGAFDPWGGPGYDKCAQLINDQFADVFYKQNIAVGATSQSFYMTYGGTNWGWLGMPQNYTSYDYGAAIRETRQLDPKYDQDKLIGYFTQAAAPLTKTDAIPVTDPDNSRIVDTARKNPDTGTQFHVLRHSDSTSTSKDTTHISLDFNAKPVTDQAYTYDDNDAALKYSGSWSHVADQSYTGGDYKHTESFSKTAGDSLTVPFTGTAVRWIGSQTDNHGYADVYLDGVLQGTVDDSGSANQAVLFQKSGLTDGPHTLKIVVDGRHGSGSTDDYVAIDAIDLTVPTNQPATYPTVPQQPGTGIALDGRESKIIVADYDLGGNQLRYSTSELMTNATIGGHDVAVLYGDAGTAGETVLRYASKPTVTSTGGDVTETWDPATGDLRLNYTHKGLARVRITGGGHPLQLLLADTATAKTFWRQDTASGPVLVRGTHLVRTATTSGSTVELTGDVDTDGSIEVWSDASKITWNGSAVTTTASGDGSLVGKVPTAAPIELPALTNWVHTQESPEAQPRFDDSTWAVADKMTTNSITTPGTLPVLFADDYGFHTGSTWYRGRFTGTGKETGISLSTQSGGGAAASSVWLNGVFLGSSTSDGTRTYTLPAGSVHAGPDNLISVLTVNMGHEEDYNESSGNKAARGLTGARLVGSPNTITWKLQGARGGESPLDTVRGPLSVGGLYGERAGWYLPGYSTGTWQPVTLPATDKTPGVSWYATNVTLQLPPGQDTSLGLTISDNPSRKYRAEIFVNGWDMGNYVNYLGPQHSFPIPNGVLNPHGTNDIKIAVWNLDGSTGGLGTVALTDYGSHASPLTVTQNTSPRYNGAEYQMPQPPISSVNLQVPGTVTAGTAFTATETVSVNGGTAENVTPALRLPDGWTAGAPTPTSAGRLESGQSATFTFTITPPATIEKPAPITATASMTQQGSRRTFSDERIVGPIPPVPPAGQDKVSDLPWLSSTNGWGPVERDTSVGEQAAGDGNPITINGTVYAKGLGTNAVSDVAVYLGGTCSRFTATVGMDDEKGDNGTVTFSVVLDGKTLITTPTVTGSTPAISIDVPVTGGQVVDLIVGDTGDGNGNDHGDWANPVLTCSG